MMLPPRARDFVACRNPKISAAPHNTFMKHEITTIAGRIAWAINRHGGTHAEIAEHVGVARAQVTMWAQGSRTPQLANLLALAKVLDVSPGWLIEGDSVGARDDEEREVVDLFRELPGDTRRTARQMLRALKSVA